MGEASDELCAYVTSLRRHALALVRDPVEADELLQETMKSALSSLRNGREILNLKAYLFAILHNIRARRLRDSYDVPVHVAIDQVADSLSSCANQEARAELRGLLAAVNGLPKEQREVILLVCLEGFRYQEAAAILGVPVGTIMSRLSRGRSVLIARMSPHEPVALKKVK